MIVVLKEDFEPSYDMHNFLEMYDANRYCFPHIEEVQKSDKLCIMLSEYGWMGIEKEAVDEIIED